jgi:hypothetical protein
LPVGTKQTSSSSHLNVTCSSTDDVTCSSTDDVACSSTESDVPAKNGAIYIKQAFVSLILKSFI